MKAKAIKTSGYWVAQVGYISPQGRDFTNKHTITSPSDNKWLEENDMDGKIVEGDVFEDEFKINTSWNSTPDTQEEDFPNKFDQLQYYREIYKLDMAALDRYRIRLLAWMDKIEKEYSPEGGNKQLWYEVFEIIIRSGDVYMYDRDAAIAEIESRGIRIKKIL